jgi:hypothetical protein
MSSIKHATVSAWQRDHDGTYTAEIHGFKLQVLWRPESPEEPRGFFWKAEAPDGTRIVARETHEEIEIAMAEAESVADPPEGDGVDEAA